MSRTASTLAQSLFAQVVYTLGQWITVAVLAHYGTPANVGEYAFALAVTAPIAMFLSMRLRQLQATDQLGQFEFSDYLGFRILTLLVGFVAIGALVGVMGERADELTVAFVGLAKLVELLGEVFHGLYQQKERLGLQLWSIASRSFFGLLGFTSGLAISGLRTAVALQLVGWSLTLVIYDLPTARRLVAEIQRWVPSIRSSRVLLRAAIPLGVVSLLGSLAVNSPRYLLEREADIGALGLFAAIGYIPMAASRLAQGISQALAARFGRSIGEPAGMNALLRRTYVSLSVVWAILTLLALKWGGLGLGLVYGEQYASGASILLPMCVASYLDSCGAMASTALTALRQNVNQALIEVLVVVAVVLAGLVLIPGLGAFGAACSAAFASAVRLAGLLLLAGKRFRGQATTHIAGGGTGDS